MTDMFDLSRVSKTDPRIICLAAIDELNSWLGIIGGLEKIQNDLFELGAVIGGFTRSGQMGSRLKELEKVEEELEVSLPPLQNFILPDNQLHLARAVCRRAEIELVKVLESGKKENTLADKNAELEICLAYLNRLSDHLFLLARSQNSKEQKKEVIWRKM